MCIHGIMVDILLGCGLVEGDDGRVDPGRQHGGFGRHGGASDRHREGIVYDTEKMLLEEDEV